MKTGTLIRLLASELKERKIVRNKLADDLSYTPTYLNRMLRGEKMSTLLFEEILEASGITLQDLAARENSEVMKSEDFGPRFNTIEQEMQTLKGESLPARVAKLEAQVEELKAKLNR